MLSNRFAEIIQVEEPVSHFDTIAPQPCKGVLNKLNFLLTPQESHRHKSNIFSFCLPNPLVLLSFVSVKIFLLTPVFQAGTQKYSPSFPTFSYFPNPASLTFSKSLSSPCPLIPIPVFSSCHHLSHLTHSAVCSLFLNLVLEKRLLGLKNSEIWVL